MYSCILISSVIFSSARDGHYFIIIVLFFSFFVLGFACNLCDKTFSEVWEVSVLLFHKST